MKVFIGSLMVVAVSTLIAAAMGAYLATFISSVTLSLKALMG